MQYFTRNADLNDHATRRSNDLQPRKPLKELLSMQGLFISILCQIMLKDADRVFYLEILISYLLAHNFNIDLTRFFTVLLFILIMCIP